MNNLSTAVPNHCVKCGVSLSASGIFIDSNWYCSICAGSSTVTGINPMVNVQIVTQGEWTESFKCKECEIKDRRIDQLETAISEYRAHYEQFGPSSVASEALFRQSGHVETTQD